LKIVNLKLHFSIVVDVEG